MTRRADRGAASLEYTGALVIVSVLVAALGLTLLGSTPVIGPTVRWAVCEIVTLGLGGCRRPSPTAAPHVPTQPCVLTSSATSVNREIAVVVVTGSNNNSYEVAELSDGRYRVTELKGGSVGAEVGVGGGVTFTYNDQQYGANATADAGVSARLQAGRIWYTDDVGEANRLISNLQGDAIEDSVTGPLTRPLYDLGRWGVDKITGHDSGYPPADEFAVEGGVTLNASAQASDILRSGAVSASSATLLGARRTKDGHTTVYVKNELSASATAQVLDVNPNDLGAKGVGLSGTVTLVTAITVDSSGTVTQVSSTAAGAKQSTGLVTALFGGSGDPSFTNQDGDVSIYQATLPVRTPQDAQTATRYFAAAGIAQVDIGTLGTVPLVPTGTVVGALPGATADFLAAARDHGTITRQTFDESTGGVGVEAEGKLGVELGGGASVQTVDRRSTGASYWDGTRWADWKACA